MHLPNAEQAICLLKCQAEQIQPHLLSSLLAEGENPMTQSSAQKGSHPHFSHSKGVGAAGTNER